MKKLSRTKRKNEFYDLILRDGTRCGLCGEDMSQEISDLLPIYKRSAKNKPWRNAINIDVDHIQPRSLGGDNLLENKQLTHRTCNSKKGNTFAGERKPLPPIDYSKWRRTYYA
jgi:5-methylcytosine-specific restriction endonuclease McrA